MTRGAPFRSLAIATVCASLALGACETGVEAPGPGTFLLDVTSETGPPGGAILLLEGSVLELMPESGRLFQRSASAGLRVAIVGTSGEALRFRARVPDSSRPPAATVEQVVSFGNEPISSSRYEVKLTPAD